jgi:O-antigen ligase
VKPVRKPLTPERQAFGAMPAIFAGLLGAFLGLSLLKFGNPVIMEKWVTPPRDLYEFFLGYPWPIGWAYGLLFVVALSGLFCFRRVREGVPRWLIVLPIAWLVWEFLSGTQSLDSRLSHETVKHFVACVACFYLGFFSLRQTKNLIPFWLGLFFGFLVVLGVGLEQHFGGLAESKRYFFLYVYPNMSEPPPPEYLKKISSNRIFSTLFYPNALAGALLLLLPVTLASLSVTRRMTAPAKAFLMTLIGLAAMACLYWSGSKGGFLLMLLLGMIALLRVRFNPVYKTGLVSAVLVLGLSAFFSKYAAFFNSGATSVSARFDYWRAAAQTVQERPVFGTGPGTFAIPYQRLKRPESEMSRLVHNDYLEQASDSGIIGCVLYTTFIVGGLVWSFPRLTSDSLRKKIDHKDDRDAKGGRWMEFSLWLGVLGVSLQGLFEFGLYIPGLAWTCFVFMGWLLAQAAVSNGESAQPQIQSTKVKKTP